MDSGVVNGVKSVMFILRPLLRVLEQIYRKENEFIMMHPKKALQEIGGSLLVMKAVKEDYFASMVCSLLALSCMSLFFDNSPLNSSFPV